MFTHKSGSNPGCLELCVCLEISFFLNTFWWKIFPSPCTFLSSEGHFPPPQSNVLRTKDRAAIPTQATKNYWSGCSRLKLSTQSKSDKEGPL